MSQDLDQILIEQFLSEAHIEFQSKGFLLEQAVRMKTGTKGTSVHFPVFGNGIANQKAPQDTVTPLNISSRDVSVTLEDWYAAEYVDRSFKNKIAVNATSEYSQICAMALARRSDQMVIDAATAVTYAASPTSAQGTDIVAGGTGFTWDKFRAMVKAHRARAAGGDIYCVMDAEAEEDLINEQELTSSDFVNQKAIAGDGLNGMTIMGVHFIVLPDMPEGGLPSGVAYSWNKMAMGMAMSEKLGGDISWENKHASYLVNMWLEANAVNIDPLGSVRVNFV